jgi:AbrB family looped-hinge helix DNA binding protein
MLQIGSFACSNVHMFLNLSENCGADEYSSRRSPRHISAAKQGSRLRSDAKRLILLIVLQLPGLPAMATAKTRISTKGQIVLPKALRDRQGWRPGDELVVEERSEGVMLRREVKYTPSRMEDVFGSLGPSDRVVSIEEMNQGVLEEAARRWRRKGFASD